MEATGAIAYNLIQNNGHEAGMSIAHVHVHIIPRFPDSTHSFLWQYGTIDHEDANSLAENIRNLLECPGAFSTRTAPQAT